MRVCDEKQRRQVGLNFVGMCWRRRGSGMEGHIGCSPQQHRNTFWPALAFCFKVELGLFSKAFFFSLQIWHLQQRLGAITWGIYSGFRW